MFTRVWLLVCALTLAPYSPKAQVSDGAVTIGVLTDLSGVYTDIAGRGSVVAAEMAVEDFGGTVLGKPIKLLAADHKNKPDIGSTIARKWIDEDKVDAFADLVTSSVGLAIQSLATESKRIVLNSSAGTSKMTNDACSPYSVSWVYDTYSLATVAARAILEEGGDTWFFITADYSFGHDLEADVRRVLERKGAKILGSIKHPFPSTDMSSFLLRAQASGAKVIALANAGKDTINAITQAREFGIIGSGVKVVALLAFETDIRAIGLDKAQGTYVTTGFIWTGTPEARAWSDKFYAKTKRRPTSVQAGVYSSVMHYLKAVAAAGTDDPDRVMAQMRRMRVNDFFTKDGYIRADGRMVHDLYLGIVKTPKESREEWDYIRLLKTVPGDLAFRPATDSVCPLFAKKAP